MAWQYAIVFRLLFCQHIFKRPVLLTWGVGWTFACTTSATAPDSCSLHDPGHGVSSWTEKPALKKHVAAWRPCYVLRCINSMLCFSAWWALLCVHNGGCSDRSRPGRSARFCVAGRLHKRKCLFVKFAEAFQRKADLREYRFCSLSTFCTDGGSSGYWNVYSMSVDILVTYFAGVIAWCLLHSY